MARSNEHCNRGAAPQHPVHTTAASTEAKHATATVHCCDPAGDSDADCCPQSPQAYRDTLALAGIGMAQVDRQGHFLCATELFCRIVGLKPDALPHLTLREVLLGDDAEGHEHLVEHLSTNGRDAVWRCERRLLRGDGSVIWAETTVRLAGQDPDRAACLLVTLRETTAYRRMIQQIRQGTGDEHRLLEAAGVGIGCYDLEGTILMLNERAARNVGGRADEFVGRKAREVLGEAIAEMIRARTERVCQTDGPATFEDRVDLPTGRRWFRSTYSCTRDARGEPTGVMIVSDDITAQKQAEQALARDKTLLRHAATIAHVGGWEINVATGRAILSDEFQRIHGIPDDELTLEALGRLLPSDEAERVKACLQATMANGEPYRVEHRIIRADTGEVRHVRAVAEAVPGSDGQPARVVGATQDITDEVLASEALCENERLLRAMSRMASIGAWEHDLTTGRAKWTDELYEIIDLPRGRQPPGVDEHLSYYPNEDREVLREAYQKAVDDGTPFDLTLRVHTAPGRQIWSRVYGEPVHDADGRCVRMRGTFQDVTDLRRAEQALRDQLTFQQTLLDAVPAPIFYKDRQGRYLGVNRAFEKMFSASREALIGKGVYDVAPEDLAAVYAAKDNELFDHPGTQVYESQVRDAAGEQHEVIFHKATFTDAEGEVAGLIGAILDVTDRHRAEEALRRSELELSAIFDGAPLPMLVVDAEGNVVKMNARAVELSRVPDGQTLGRPGGEAIRCVHALADPGQCGAGHDCTTCGIRRRVTETLETGRAIHRAEATVRYDHGDGEPLDMHVLISTAPLGLPQRRLALIVLEDITERRRAEQALREAHDRLKLVEDIVERGRTVLFRWRVAPDYPVELVTGNVWQFGYSSSDFLGGRIAWKDVVHPNDSHRLQREIEALLDSGVGEFRQNYRIFTATGKVRWVEDQNRVIRDADGRATHIEGILWDITERIEAQQALHDSELRYRTLFNTAGDEVLLHEVTPEGRPGRLIDVNEQTCRQSGYTRQELLRLSISDIVTPETRAMAPAHFETMRDRGVATFEATRVRKDGSTFPIEVSARIIELEGRPVVVSVARDISERKRAEAQLQQNRAMLETAEHLAGVGAWEADLRTEGFTASAEWCRIHGVKQAPETFEALQPLAHPDDLPAIQATWKAAIEDGAAYDLEHRIVRADDGEVRWVRAYGNIETDAAGRPCRMLGAAQDITETKLAGARLAEHHARLQSMTSELALTEERSRRTIAQDLHDNVGQDLALARMKLNMLIKDTDDPEQRARLGEVERLVEQAIGDVRGLTFDLSPPILYEFGLTAALEWLCETAEKQHDLATVFSSSCKHLALAEDLKVTLFRGTRELMVNAVKHAAAGRITVRLDCPEDRLVRVDVADDGVGFDPATIDREGGGHPACGFGLFSIRERLRFLGGRMAVMSEPGRGTQVTMEVPLRHATADEHNKGDDHGDSCAAG